MPKEQSLSRREYVGIIGGAAVGVAAGTVIGYLIPRQSLMQTRKKALLIFSYHPEYSLVMEETRGVEDVLWDKELTIERFYMDTKRHTNPEWMVKVSDDAATKIEKFAPDIVIVFDDNACEFIAKKYAGQTLPFVFCGMNREPTDYGFPTTNITGVIERLFVKETIDLLRQLVPHVEKVGIITDDNSTSRGNVKQIRETTLPVEISEIYATNDFDAWKSKVKVFQSNVDAIGIMGHHTIKNAGNEISIPSEAVLEWTLENNRLPDFSFLDFAVRGGALCGVAVSGYEQGKAAAEIAIRIIDGAKPIDIPIESPRKGDPFINGKRAAELGISIPDELIKEVEMVG